MSDAKTTCKALIKDYCANCSFAGVHFIGDESKHWSERLVWLALVVLSWYGSGLLIIAAWDAFVLSPISFGVETTYSDWDTKMPTVAICEQPNDQKIYSVSDTIWTPVHSPDLEDVLRDIAYFRGYSYSLVEICYLNNNADPNCPKTRYSYIADLVRSDCDQIMRNCSYNNKEFSCCEYFQPIETDMGTCFIINSIQTNDNDCRMSTWLEGLVLTALTGRVGVKILYNKCESVFVLFHTLTEQLRNPKPYPMVNNMKNSLGTIKFNVLMPVVMYTLGEDEVPSVSTLTSRTLKIQLGHIYRRLLSVRDIENDPLIAQTTVKQRACRLQCENEGGLYPQYSYSACTVLCRKRRQDEKCQCNDHFMLGTTEEQQCNISGLACLHSYSSHLINLKPPWSKEPGLRCECLPCCNETEITVIKDVKTRSKVRGSKKRATVEVALSHLPTERFKRNVVRSRLDLVVSIGGTTGLFVGASLLSFVELFFFFTVRFFNNVRINKQKDNGIRPVNSDNIMFRAGVHKN